MKKILLVLLSLILALSTLASCGPKKQQNEETGTVSEQEKSMADLLGFESEYNGDAVFNILLNNSEGAFTMSRDFYADENESDAVSKEIIARNYACEDYLGIDINYIKSAGNWNSDMVQKIYNQVAGGSSEFDMVAMGLNTGIMGSYIDIYQNVLEINSVKVDHDWWVQEMAEQASVNGKLIFLSGDACLSTYAYLGCVFANLKVADDFSLETDFYELVEEGGWTLEEFFRLFQLVGADWDSDGTYDPKRDIFGWANIQTGVRVMWSSCEMNLIERQEDNSFAVRSTLDDRILTFMDQVKTASTNPLAIHFTASTTQDAISAFVNNRCLFASYYVYMAQEFKANEMESHYAILPLPKYNFEQEDYISTNISAYNAIFFPFTVQDPELSGKVAEFMGYYGQSKVVPAYYDETLKYRDNDVEANVEMLDLIRDKLRVTPNELFGTIEDLIGLTPTTAANTSETGFYSNPTSFWSEKQPTYASAVMDYIVQYFQ